MDIANTCVFPRCKRENVLVWLNKPLCSLHWQWTCDHKEKAIKLFNIKPEKITVLPTDSITTDSVEVLTVVDKDSSEDQNLISKKSKQPYTDEIDKQLLELRSKNVPIGGIAKAIDRSYASTMYRIRFLESKKS